MSPGGTEDVRWRPSRSVRRSVRRGFGKIGFFNEAAPGNVAGIVGPHVGDELASDKGVAAVSADEQIAARLPAVGEAGQNTVLVLIETDKLGPLVVMVG